MATQLQDSVEIVEFTLNGQKISARSVGNLGQHGIRRPNYGPYACFTCEAHDEFCKRGIPRSVIVQCAMGFEMVDRYALTSRKTAKRSHLLTER